MSDFKFSTIDVFTETRYVGNPLAIVHIPYPAESNRPSHERMLKITQEFNLYETVFIEDPAPDAIDGKITFEGKDVRIYIFSREREMPFAGHPCIGTTCHLLGATRRASSCIANEERGRGMTLLTKAGRIPTEVSEKANGYARLEVPHKITIHDQVLAPSRAAELIGLGTSHATSVIANYTTSGAIEGSAVISIVDGLGYCLVRVPSLEILSQANLAGKWLPKGEIGLGQGHGDFIAQYVYCVVDDGAKNSTGIVKIHTRLLKSVWEDPATGSAASGLGAFLALSEQHGIGEKRRYEITQGVDMGRKSDIVIEVLTKKVESGQKLVDKIWLSGTAVEITRGTITV